MRRVQWRKVKPFLEGEVRCTRDLNLTEEHKQVALLRTGAKLYGSRKGALVSFSVSGYAWDGSDLPKELFT